MSSASKVLQDYIFTSKYARYLPEKKRRETWSEAINRVRDMMFQKYVDKNINDEITWAYDMMRKKRILGSQRALQFGGEPVFRKNARCYNCCFSYADRPRFFQEFFWLLLCGCGAGFSVQKHHVNKLPDMDWERTTFLNEDPVQVRTPKTFVIPDTIEGWSDAIGVLLASYWDVNANTEFSEYAQCNVIFDYSQIRPKGSYLSSGVGKAPGPDGLRNSLEQIRKLLDKICEDGYKKLRPIDVYDVCMHIADAVLSGGVRRSATIALFSPDDEEMAKAKTGDWLQENPQRARSNISALLVRNKTTRKQFRELLKHVREYGEPGFIWADSPESGFNPCVEVNFFSYWIRDEKLFEQWKKEHLYDAIECDPKDIGLESCWHFCNLTTTNCSNLSGETREEVIKFYLENVEAAAIVGTLQAGFSRFHYLTEASELLNKHEALLGVSMTGIMDNPDIVLDPEVQKKAAKLVLKTNEKIAKKIGINVSARATCLKPEGTGTLVLGCSAHGCHPHHYTRYLRVVQANTDETPYQFFKKHNKSACEPSVWSANKTDDIVFFPIEVPDGAKTKNQMPAVQLLETVKSLQTNWVKYGKRTDRCIVPWLTHNVSNTVTIQSDEWDGVEEFVYANRKHFAGISFVPDSADKDYPQAPNCAVYTARQIVREYGEAALWTSGLIQLALLSFDNDLWAACTAVLKEDYNPVGELDHSDPSNEEYLKSLQIAHDRIGFRNKCIKYATNYFDSDMKRLTYCMKDVFNWKRWTDLNRILTEVDYTKLIEDDDNTVLKLEPSCSSGACTIV